MNASSVAVVSYDYSLDINNAEPKKIASVISRLANYTSRKSGSLYRVTQKPGEPKLYKSEYAYLQGSL